MGITDIIAIFWNRSATLREGESGRAWWEDEAARRGGEAASWESEKHAPPLFFSPALVRLLPARKRRQASTARTPGSLPASLCPSRSKQACSPKHGPAQRGVCVFIRSGQKAHFFFSARLYLRPKPFFFWGVQMEFSIQNEINSFHLFCNNPTVVKNKLFTNHEPRCSGGHCGVRRARTTTRTGVLCARTERSQLLDRATSFVLRRAWRAPSGLSFCR